MFVARPCEVDPEDQDEFGWKAKTLDELGGAIVLQAQDLLSDTMDPLDAKSYYEYYESVGRLTGWDYREEGPFDDGVIHCEVVPDAPEYAVEVLVHYNLTITVEATSGDEAMVRAGEMARRWHPSAVLVDPINYDVVNGDPAGGADEPQSGEPGAIAP